MVYVNKLKHQGTKTWCNCYADTPKELEHMARKLQRPIKLGECEKYPHIDLNRHDRELALRYGARETE